MLLLSLISKNNFKIFLVSLVVVFVFGKKIDAEWQEIILAKWILEFLGIPRIIVGILRNKRCEFSQ